MLQHKNQKAWWYVNITADPAAQQCHLDSSFYLSLTSLCFYQVIFLRGWLPSYGKGKWLQPLWENNSSFPDGPSNCSFQFLGLKWVVHHWTKYSSQNWMRGLRAPSKPTVLRVDQAHLKSHMALKFEVPIGRGKKAMEEVMSTKETSPATVYFP